MKNTASIPESQPLPAFSHPLDNVIWQALTTRQCPFAEAFGNARRFQRDVTSLCAFPAPTPQNYANLAALAGPGGTVALFLDEPYTDRDGWTVVADAPLLEMVCDSATSLSQSSHAMLELSAADSPEMLNLATLTKPGPFGPRTHELGTYLGIRHEGKLVAMAGERLKVPGHTEVSAVCTHPDHTGKGYAQALMSEVMRRIYARGETPFLHVREANTRAVGIYEKLGFRTRVRQHVVVLRKT
jgi:ribosomal protein S18 acetylase RimI-like enzyme